MKLKNILMGLMLAASTVAVADNYAYLTIDQNNEESSISLSEISRITFDSNNMIIHMANGTKAELPLASLSKMSFTEKDITGIFAAKNGESQVKLVGGTIYVNAPVGAIVTLYNMGGQTVKTVTASSPETQINLSGLTKGVYIVRVGKQSKKVMNK